MCTKRADGLDFGRNIEPPTQATLAKRMLQSFLAMPEIGTLITSHSWLYWDMMITHDNGAHRQCTLKLEMTHECGFVLNAHTLQQMQDSSAFQLTVANRLIAFERDHSVDNLNNSIPFALSCIFNASPQLRNVEIMANINMNDKSELEKVV
jgi:hypothetical protein